jgi:hypothetical protein
MIGNKGSVHLTLYVGLMHYQRIPIFLQSHSTFSNCSHSIYHLLQNMIITILHKLDRV